MFFTKKQEQIYLWYHFSEILIYIYITLRPLVVITHIFSFKIRNVRIFQFYSCCLYSFSVYLIHDFKANLIKLLFGRPKNMYFQLLQYFWSGLMKNNKLLIPCLNVLWQNLDYKENYWNTLWIVDPSWNFNDYTYLLIKMYCFKVLA